MKIEQLLLQSHGQKIGGMTLTVKTSKKTWEIGKIWWQQVVFMDGTGEIPADVKIGGYNPIIRGSEVRVIVSEVRDAEYLGKPRKILVVDQYSIPTITVDEWNAEVEEWRQLREDEIKGKIRQGLSCAFIAGFARREADVPAVSESYTKYILEWTDFIMTGRIE